MMGGAKPGPRLASLWRDRSGATATEFVLVIPLWMTIFLALVQVAVLFWANAGLSHALGEGARVAALFSPAGRTNDALGNAIVARIEAARFGIVPDDMPDPDLSFATTAGGVPFVDISVEYNAKLLLFDVPALTLRHQRRVYLP